MATTLSSTSGIIRPAIIVEAAANTIAATFLLFTPHAVLSFIGVSSKNVAAAQLVQWIGCVIHGLTVPLAMGYPNTKGAVLKRRAAYWTLLVGEMALIPILAFQAFGFGANIGGATREPLDAGDAVIRKAMDGLGIMVGLEIPKTTLFVAIANLTPFVLWRLYLFIVKPEWFGVEPGDLKKD